MNCKNTAHCYVFSKRQPDIHTISSVHHPKPIIQSMFYLPFSTRMTVCALLATVNGTSAMEPLRVVATGGRIGYTFYTPAAGNTSFWHRTPHKLGEPVSEIQVGFMDLMYTDKTETANADNEVTITAAWLERASTGQVVPFTFAGSRQLILPMNSTTPYWLCDAIPSSTWTGSAPARDEVFWLHAKGSIPEAGKIPVGTPATYSGGSDSSLKDKFIVYPPANPPPGWIPTNRNARRPFSSSRMSWSSNTAPTIWLPPSPIRTTTGHPIFFVMHSGFHRSLPLLPENFRLPCCPAKAARTGCRFPIVNSPARMTSLIRFSPVRIYQYGCRSFRMRTPSSIKSPIPIRMAMEKPVSFA